MDLQEGRLRARRILEDGYEVVETTLPAVCTILSDDHNVPRYSKLKDIMAASRKTVTVWGAKDLSLEASKVGAANVRVPIGSLAMSQRESHCELITGETTEEQVAQLVAELRARKVF